MIVRDAMRKTLTPAGGATRRAGRVSLRWWAAVPPILLAALASFAWRALDPQGGASGDAGGVPGGTPSSLVTSSGSAAADEREGRAIREPPPLPPSLGRRGAVASTAASAAATTEAPETRPALPSRVMRLDEEPRRARLGTERWHREEARELAASDPETFAVEARARLEAPDAPREEKLGLLLAARDADPALARRLYAVCLDPGTRDDAFRRALAGHLMAKRMRDPGVAESLHAAVVLDPRAGEDLRARAAAAACAAAPGEALEAMVDEIERCREPALLHAALSALSRNPSPRARAILESYARARAADPEARRIAAAGLEGALPGAEARADDDW